LNLISQTKTKKILGRGIKAIDSAKLSESILARLIEFFEYLDICRQDAPEADIELFINSVLAALVPFIAKCPLEGIQSKLSLLAKKSSLPWIVTNKAGVVLSCIILSRVEILKAAGEEIPSGIAEAFFDQIQDRLSDVFANLHGVDSEFYGWQFMALLAMNCDADRKRVMVMDLRDRIMVVVQKNDPKNVSNLNIFLNVLGLDASQLAQSS
jgi:hypothetical protein